MPQVNFRQIFWHHRCFFYSFPAREPIPWRVPLGPLIQHLDWPNLTVFPLFAAALTENKLQDNFGTCSTSYITALLLLLILNNMFNWIVTASTILPSPRATFSGVENDRYLVKYSLLGVMWLDPPESTNHLSSEILSDTGNAPSWSPSLSDSISSSVTFARCCDFSFHFGQNRWMCPTSSQVQHLGGLRFWAPTSAESCRASGFDSWALSFRSWWISCYWTKSIFRLSTRASRAMTIVENDEGKLPRRVTTWSSSEIGAPIELSLSVSSFISFRCMSIELPSLISFRKNCFLRKSLLARVSLSMIRTGAELFPSWTVLTNASDSWYQNHGSWVVLI